MTVNEATDRRADPALPLGPAVLGAAALATFGVAGLCDPVVKTLLAGLFPIAILTRRLRRRSSSRGSRSSPASAPACWP